MLSYRDGSLAQSRRRLQSFLCEQQSQSELSYIQFSRLPTTRTSSLFPSHLMCLGEECSCNAILETWDARYVFMALVGSKVVSSISAWCKGNLTEELKLPEILNDAIQIPCDCSSWVQGRYPSSRFVSHARRPHSSFPSHSRTSATISLGTLTTLPFRLTLTAFSVLPANRPSNNCFFLKTSVVVTLIGNP